MIHNETLAASERRLRAEVAELRGLQENRWNQIQRLNADCVSTRV